MAPERVAVELQLRKRPRVVDTARCQFQHGTAMAAGSRMKKVHACCSARMLHRKDTPPPALQRQLAVMTVAADDRDGARPGAQQREQARALGGI